ncbi:phage tail tape measure protein [Paracoccus aminophilus]|uniref:Phage-related tail protein n=1 Tax=Paracoccus aminophilus JCM 7686 TaxID=1367847 RepID=S5XQ18_PARAH|nr:phage tail tape measure protein [Paracoccus aminophilus]AGT09469.1 phage-related tail protein [Paracoccus aminophilus JCM 7686]
MARTFRSALVVELMDRVSGPAKRVGAALRSMSGGYGELGDNARTRLDAAMARNNASLAKARAGMIDAAAGAIVLKGAFGLTMGAAMDLEDEMADIAKVSGMSSDELRSFEGIIRNLARSEIPLAVEELADLAAAASQSGIANEDLEAFTKQVAKSAVAWGVSGQYAGESLAKIKTALGMTIDETARYADAINYLDDSSSSSAEDLVEFARRVATDGKIAGFTNEQTLALGSAMISMGAQADVAATSLRNAGKALTRGASATKRQDIAFAKLGLTAEEVAKAMPNDALGQMLMVLQKIKDLDQHEQISTMSDLFGDEARALMPLLSNLDEVRKSTGELADQTNYLGSVQKEFEIRSKTGRYALQRFRNVMRDLAISIGQSLLPAMKQILEAVAPVLAAIADWAQKNPKLLASIVAVAGGVIGLRVALATLRYVGLFGKSGVLSLLSFGLNSIAGTGRGLLSAASASIALQRSLAAMSGAKMTGLQTISTGMRGMIGAVPGMRTVASVVGAVVSAIGAISAPVWVGIAAAVAAVGAAWKYWDRISAIVSGVASAIGEALSPVVEGLKPLLEPLRPVLDAFGAAWDRVKAAISGAVDYVRSIGGSIFSKEVLTPEEVAAIKQRAHDLVAGVISKLKELPAKIREGAAELLQAGKDLLQSLWDGAIAKFDEFLAWCGEIPGKIKSAIGNINLTSLITGGVAAEGTGAKFTSQGGGGAQGNYVSDGVGGFKLDGARAKGGPISAGGTYLVGEEGPEVITPSRSGYVNPNGSGGGAAPITVNATINVPALPSESAETIARRVKQLFDRDVGASLRASMADLAVE